MAHDFDLEVDGPERVRLADFRSRRNVLLVFHPFAFTAVCGTKRAISRRNQPSFDSAQTTSYSFLRHGTARQPGRNARAHLHVASDFCHTEPRRRRTGLRRDDWRGGQGHLLIDKRGIVVWSLVNDPTRAARSSSPVRSARRM